MFFTTTHHHPSACAEDRLTHPASPIRRRRAHQYVLVRQDNGCFSMTPTTPSPTCAGCELPHCPSGWLVSQDNRCFSKPPTSTPRPAQRIDLRTATLLWEGGLCTISGWLAKVMDVFLNLPTLLHGRRRRLSYAFRLFYEKKACAI
jgi:hypothetical protein